MGHRRRAVTLLHAGREGPAFITVHIRGAFMIFAACRPVDLLATLIRVGFSAGHKDTPVTVSEGKRQRNEVEESRCVA